MSKIYLISAEINNTKLYKIGYTKRSIDKRIKEFRTGNASEFIIVEEFESKWASKIEALLHRKFKEFKINGEWFNLLPQDIIDFKKYCNLFNENLEIISKSNTYFLEKGDF